MDHRLEVVAEVELDVVVGVGRGIDDGVELLGVDVEQRGVVLTGHEHLEAVVVHVTLGSVPAAVGRERSVGLAVVHPGRRRSRAPEHEEGIEASASQTLDGLHRVGRATGCRAHGDAGEDHETDDADGDQEERRTPLGQQPLEGIGHGGAEVATGGDERRERVTEGRRALGEVEEPGGGDHQQHRTDDHSRGAAGLDAVTVVRAPQQQGAARDEREGDDHPQHAHE